MKYDNLYAIWLVLAGLAVFILICTMSSLSSTIIYGIDKCYQYYNLSLQTIYRTASTNSATTIAARTFQAVSLLLLITTGIIVG